MPTKKKKPHTKVVTSGSGHSIAHFDGIFGMAYQSLAEDYVILALIFFSFFFVCVSVQRIAKKNEKNKKYMSKTHCTKTKQNKTKQKKIIYLPQKIG